VHSRTRHTVVAQFKAIELDATSRRRTGREYSLPSDTRQEAVSALLHLLNLELEQVQIDPTRTMVRVNQSLWTIVAPRQLAEPISPSLRRAGAKHKHVR
jgi:hypothetical protein